jgi:hypothetical protein
MKSVGIELPTGLVVGVGSKENGLVTNGGIDKLSVPDSRVDTIASLACRVLGSSLSDLQPIPLFPNLYEVGSKVDLLLGSGLWVTSGNGFSGRR